MGWLLIIASLAVAACTLDWLLVIAPLTGAACRLDWLLVIASLSGGSVWVDVEEKGRLIRSPRAHCGRTKNSPLGTVENRGQVIR